MLKYKKLTLEDKDLTAPYFEADDSRSCEVTFANVYLWSRYYPVEYAIAHGCMILRAPGGGGYRFPCGSGDQKAAVETMMAEAEEAGEHLCIYLVTPAQAAQLEEWFPGRFAVAFERDDADYVYDGEKLRTLSGKKYHGKRNHIHRFEETYPDWTYEPLSQDNVEECFQMTLEWRREKNEEHHQEEMEEEQNAEVAVTCNALRLYRELDLTGGVLRAGGKVVAFAIGEPLTEDTYVVHIEKAYSEIQGAYPMINREFARRAAAGYAYINREEDMGEPNLRYTKENYHPVMLVEKGIARLVI